MTPVLKRAWLQLVLLAANIYFAVYLHGKEAEVSELLRSVPCGMPTFYASAK